MQRAGAQYTKSKKKIKKIWIHWLTCSHEFVVHDKWPPMMMEFTNSYSLPLVRLRRWHKTTSWIQNDRLPGYEHFWWCCDHMALIKCTEYHKPINHTVINASADSGNKTKIVAVAAAWRLTKCQRASSVHIPVWWTSSSNCLALALCIVYLHV